MRLVLLLLHLPDVTGTGSRSLVAFLHLRRLQYALWRETGAEMVASRAEIGCCTGSPAAAAAAAAAAASCMATS